MKDLFHDAFMYILGFRVFSIGDKLIFKIPRWYFRVDPGAKRLQEEVERSIQAGKWQ